MSIEALSWGMKQDISTPTTKLVLIVLCNYANADNICYPSEKHLGMIVGVSERSVRRCIKNLKELGLIKINPRNFKSNEYELLLGHQ
jgi:pyocin large subunit-like protein